MKYFQNLRSFTTRNGYLATQTKESLNYTAHDAISEPLVGKLLHDLFHELFRNSVYNV
jgi:hypothetical protein